LYAKNDFLKKIRLAKLPPIVANITLYIRVITCILLVPQKRYGVILYSTYRGQGSKKLTRPERQRLALSNMWTYWRNHLKNFIHARESGCYTGT